MLHEVSHRGTKTWEIMRIAKSTRIALGIGFILIAIGCNKAKSKSAIVEFRHKEISVSENSSIDAPVIVRGDTGFQFSVVGEVVGRTAVAGEDYSPASIGDRLTFSPQSKVPTRIGRMGAVTWLRDHVPETTKTVILELTEAKTLDPLDQILFGENRQIVIHVIDDDGAAPLSGRQYPSFIGNDRGSSLVSIGPDGRRWAVNSGAASIFSLDANGSADRAFESFLFEDRSTSNARLTSVFPTNDAVYVAGKFTHFAQAEVGNIIKLNLDGTRDKRFNPASESGSTITRILVDNMSRVYAIGDFETFGGKARSQLVRLTSTGEVDDSFRDFEEADSQAGKLEDIALLSDRSVLVAGRFSRFDGVHRTGIVKLNEDGGLADSFVFFPAHLMLSDTSLVLIGRIAVSESDEILAISGTRNEPSPRNSLNINRYFSPP
jgi:hypothetical protein